MEQKLIKIYELSQEILTELKHLHYKDTEENFNKITNAEKNFDMGIFQGSKGKAFSIAKKLIAYGMSVEDVSRITELSSFEIKNFITYD